MEEKFYTVKEFAQRHGVSRQTAYKWIKKGYLKPVEKKMGGFSILLIPKKVAGKFRPPKTGRPTIKG